jgi:beta-glucanase (GH16 family)|eukprot:COSAG06_NODE_8027_length_2295_cov_16.040984_2_plen_90_part_00
MTKPTLPFDLTTAYHNISVLWTPNLLTFAVDGVVYRRVTVTSESGGGAIPTIPGYIKYILRPGDAPHDHVYKAPAEMGVRWLRYEPLPS